MRRALCLGGLSHTAYCKIDRIVERQVDCTASFDGVDGNIAVEDVVERLQTGGRCSHILLLHGHNVKEKNRQQKELK